MQPPDITKPAEIKIYHKLHLLVYLLEYMKMHGPGNIKSLTSLIQTDQKENEMHGSLISLW
jgi:hypothetical protein